MNIFEIENDNAKKYLQDEGVTDVIYDGFKDEMNPKWDDLARLYYLVRERKPFEILEFGSGYSTLVMAYALKKNWEEYLQTVNSNSTKKSPKFKQPFIYSIESSEHWRNNTVSKIKKSKLGYFSEISNSKLKITEFKGQICHYYESLPDIVPDFVYLDGPDPLTVEGSINGISFQNLRRTVMAADILKYESTILPGFFMIIDGRSNNARFLERNLNRNYNVNYHQKADVTTFKLMEDKLGEKNIFGFEAYSGNV